MGVGVWGGTRDGVRLGVGRLEVEGVFSELSLSLFLVTLPFTVSPVFWHK